VLGPGTNIGSLLKLHPELAPRIVKLIAVVGRRTGQRFTAGTGKKALRDFNFELDAPSFQAILDSKVPLVLAPWEISSKVWLSKADLDRLRPNNPAIDYLYEPAMDWLALWKRDFDVDAFNPFDTLAVGYLTVRSSFRCEVLPARISTLPDDTGATKEKPYFLVDPKLDSKYKVEYCSDPGSAFKADLLSRLKPQS